MLCTHCVALCCAALHEALKNARKKRYSGDKTELRKEHCRFAKSSKRPPPCARAIAGFPAQERSRVTPSVPKSDACDARELWCFALVSSSSCLQSGKPRVAADVSAPKTLLWDACGCIDSGRTSSIMPAGKHIRARVVAAQSSYPRATLCA